MEQLDVILKRGGVSINFEDELAMKKMSGQPLVIYESSIPCSFLKYELGHIIYSFREVDSFCSVYGLVNRDKFNDDGHFLFESLKEDFCGNEYEVL